MESLRKYLISDNIFLSDFPYDQVKIQDKAYVLFHPETEHRSISHSVRFTREAIEISNSVPLYPCLNVPDAPTIRKVIYRVGDWNVERFGIPLHRLALAWIVLQENEDVPLYGWLQPHVIKEVTDDPDFTDRSLALKGLPSYI